MLRLYALAGVLLLTACPLPHEPTPELAPDVRPVTSQELATVRQELALLHQDLAGLAGRVETLEPWTTRIASLEARLAGQPPTRKGKQMPPGREPQGVQLVALAQKDARVYPSQRGYFGNSGEQAYSWSPGTIYTIYLCQRHPTLISLPPGERMLAGMMLEKEKYDVRTERAGSDSTAYDAIAITPLFEKGDADTFLVTESGRRYLFHFVIGDSGMLAVTFEAAAIPQGASREPTLILPNPFPERRPR